MSWETIERPGYFGAERDEKQRHYDAIFGEDSWRLAWVFQGSFLSWLEMTHFYEQAYYEFLEEHPDVLEQLITEASDVYDDAPSNMLSRHDYEVQETNRTHVQDIAIRRVVSRLGYEFQGKTPIQIRDVLGHHSLSVVLSPGQVPFHLPHILVQPEMEGWWQPGSVESFYQSNKVLQVKDKK